MTPEQFAYWLQGFAELTTATRPSEEQWNSIKEHLMSVMQKITPPAPGSVTITTVDPSILTDGVMRIC